MGNRNHIQGSTYDTDLAEFVAAATVMDDGGEGTETGLYLSHDGRWFLVVHPTERPSGAVVPLTASQAEAWCVQHDIDGDVIDAYFAAGDLVTHASQLPEPFDDLDPDVHGEGAGLDDDLSLDRDIVPRNGFASSRFDN